MDILKSLLETFSKIDINGIASIIAIIAAVISPTITAHIYSKKDLKLKSLELLFNTKVDAYSKFIAISSESTQNDLSPKEMIKLQAAASNAILLSTSETQAKIASYSSALLTSKNHEIIADAYSQMLSALHSEIYAINKSGYVRI